MTTLHQLVERMNRPGLLGLVGKTVQKRCQRDLESYFSGLGKAIAALNLEDLAHEDRTLDPEHARHAVQMRMHNLLRTRQPLLQAVLEQNILDALQAAEKVHVLAEADLEEADNETGIDKLGMTGEEAARYAAEHANELLAGLDETTQQIIADAVSTGISERLGVPGTAKLILDAIHSMSTSRAEMIAATEMNDAMSQAFLKKLVNNQIEYKQWIVGPNPCEDCIANADQGAIPVDESFDSGDDAPPAHPNCVCAIAGGLPPEEADQE